MEKPQRQGTYGMNIFVSGKPGCGKSTLIKEIIEEFKNKKIAGIITPELRDGYGYRKGFEVIDLASGAVETMASVGITNGPRISRYGVNIGGIDKIVELFLRSFEAAEFVFIDEIGKMEFFSEKFRQMLERVLGSDKKIIATLHQNYVDEFKNKGIIFNLTRENKGEVKKKILEILG